MKCISLLDVKSRSPGGEEEHESVFNARAPGFSAKPSEWPKVGSSCLCGEAPLEGRLCRVRTPSALT